MKHDNLPKPVASIKITKDLDLFDVTKKYLESKGASFISDMRGLDQNYADFSFNNSTYTLSSDNYLGIAIDCYSQQDKVHIENVAAKFHSPTQSKL